MVIFKFLPVIYSSSNYLCETQVIEQTDAWIISVRL
jgi:hypothetical protein